MTLKSEQFTLFLSTLLLVGIFFIIALPAFAQEEGIVQCGGPTEDPCTICDIPVTIDRLIDYVIKNFVTPAAILMVMVGGFMILTAGPSPQRVETGKKILTNTLIGILIIFFSWMIVNTILVVLGTSRGGVGGFLGIDGKFLPWNELQSTGDECILGGGSVTTSSDTTGGGGTAGGGTTGGGTVKPPSEPTKFVLSSNAQVGEGGSFTTPVAVYSSKQECEAARAALPLLQRASMTCDETRISQLPKDIPEYAPSGALTAKVARDTLEKNKITVNHPNECPAGTRYQDVVGSCTSLEGILGSTVNGVIDFKNACKCSVEVTGGTELGHTDGPTGHASGQKIDLDRNAAIDKYITSNYTKDPKKRSDGATLYRSPTGVVFAQESNHWDVKGWDVQF